VDDGFDWFPDLGSDDYNVYKYFDYGYRQYYYRNSAEGHNQVIITSQKEAVPFGQAYVGKGVITDFHSEDAGMYAILDNTTAYGGFAKFARRGMLVTNNRNTVVIQDEISFGSTEIVAWIGHTKASGIKLSDDKRTAYLSHTVNNRVEYIRVSIVSSDSSIKFEVMTCGVQPDMSDTLLEGMFDMSYSKENGGINEKSRNEYRRLVIKTNPTLSFNCAVVIEDVEGDDDQKPVGYKYVPMNSWKEGSIKDSYEDLNGETNGGAGDKSDIITNAKLGDITSYTAQARRLVESGYALTTRAVDFFKSLVRVSAAVNTYRPETFQSIAPIQKAYEEYLGYLSIYKAYSDGINRNYSNSDRIAIGLLGM
jgi:hypothetical protein